ncbi:MAG: hypothetical protein P1V20_28705 [Verrucomicrobiales bacterium]|nr:hypothetical protein [Verrucomicrobiales bacterium]
MTLRDNIKTILEGELHDPDYRETWLDDLEYHGCVSGMVSDLIYYHDTIAFFETHEEEILYLAKEYDFHPSIVALGETGVKNSLAWFAFETLAREVFESMEFP